MKSAEEEVLISTLHSSYLNQNRRKSERGSLAKVIQVPKRSSHVLLKKIYACRMRAAVWGVGEEISQKILARKLEIYFQFLFFYRASSDHCRYLTEICYTKWTSDN
jgi:hypothetical protein